MKSRKAILKKEVFRIIIAVLCLVVLLVLAGKLYGAFIKKSDLEKAKGTLEEIAEIAEGLDAEETYIVLSPKDWYLKSFVIQEYLPPGTECTENFESCLCACKDVFCGGAGVCKGFDLDVKVSWSENIPLGTPVPIGLENYFSTDPEGRDIALFTISFKSLPIELKIYDESKVFEELGYIEEKKRIKIIKNEK